MSQTDAGGSNPRSLALIHLSILVIPTQGPYLEARSNRLRTFPAQFMCPSGSLLPQPLHIQKCQGMHSTSSSSSEDPPSERSDPSQALASSSSGQALPSSDSDRPA
eukprot:CAMPEP_0198470020 /NCGR_PEP_ID=MMETSP1456-20131121/15680_1 /TAXON_ID=1461544 ORGANISM="Unidentified sp., Strain RCC1871" /NCGR_SAMPLE_ID=MMETSP1456 /ASSEMBLY_ACC=CAM_ASM_001119 /LENGTH=105 /DNA_ID=CAMNT_0044196487 /DNA_START=72 /DNA_END=386 /DNA_ORIENTATION=+